MTKITLKNVYQKPASGIQTSDLSDQAKKDILCESTPQLTEQDKEAARQRIGITDEHILAVVEAAYPAAEGVGF